MQAHHISSFLCWTLIFSGIFSALCSCHSMTLDFEEDDDGEWDATTDNSDSTTADTTTEVTTTVTAETTTVGNDDATGTTTDAATTTTTSESLKPMMTWTETLMLLSNKGSVDEPERPKETKKDEVSDAVDKAVKALENIKRVWDKKKQESNSKKKKHKVSKPKPKGDNINIDIKADSPINLKANVEKSGKSKLTHHRSKPKSEDSPNEYSHQLKLTFSPTSKSDDISPEKSDFVRKGAEFLRYAWERFKENKNNEQR